MDFDNRTILVLSKSQQIRVILLFLLFINQALLINPLLSFVSLLEFVFLSLFAFVFVCLLFVPTISGKSVENWICIYMALFGLSGTCQKVKMHASALREQRQFPIEVVIIVQYSVIIVPSSLASSSAHLITVYLCAILN